MTAVKKQYNLLRMLVVITTLFVVAQVVLLLINASTTKFFDTAVSSSLTSQILRSTIFVVGSTQFLAAHFLIYTIFVGLLWYLAIAMGELFSLRETTTYVFGIILLFISFIFILSANYYFVPHSFFSNLIRSNLLSNTLVDTPILYALALSGWVLLTVGCLAISHLFFSLYRKQNCRRHLTVLILITVVAASNIAFHPGASRIAASAPPQKPNIIIIGIDAMRPDFVGFYNKSVTHTPHIDAFLQSGMNFSTAYTALPRTFPSWTSILTGAYPKHTGARGNNTDLSEIKTDATLPKTLQQAGYETIYSTDDTRFNNTNEQFGFDRVITPPMGLNDFLLGTINDFPLSNLIIPTPLGRHLFPYNYANHGTSITYDPSNYLQLLKDALRQREQKPLFLAVHFTVTHWPFYWFNDKLREQCREMCRYQAGIGTADKQLGNFLDMLQANHLLDHAIVVLLSDHGTSMGLPGDRITDKAQYQGNNKSLIKKLSVMKYSNAPDASLDFNRDYGVDTSYGYGGDVLSLKQYHAVLALKGYGYDIGKARTISERVLLLDIAPTLLDLLHLPSLAHTDGVSLKPYLKDPTYALRQRTLFFESSFTVEEIEKEGISVEKVLAKTVKLYRMDPKSGLVFIKKEAEQGMDQNKQKAVIQGDWLLAEYPESARTKLLPDKNSQSMTYEITREPPYLVLVNLKTRAWTLELNGPFAQNAPLKSLQNQLYGFYGTEITPIVS